jgi:hypothetical protein
MAGSFPAALTVSVDHILTLFSPARDAAQIGPPPASTVIK